VQAFELTPFFSPTAHGHIKLEAISFKLSHSDEVTVTIEDSAGDDVATLVRDHALTRYKQFSLRWNGRRGSASRYAFISTESGRSVLVPLTRGTPAPAGVYRVRVSLRDEHRSVQLPRTFTLVRK
jgi:hypothetical protein